ncbi:unnamed protein product [Haemonchus placei]|uniref:Mitochondrial DNA polymerase catalytic subunit n=1 Tax=Haemonchus placei TaxID=6290 RepID=A0A3P7W046_HAEPC|nr:unnamed protein product [Haemonchus placei]
MLAVHQHLYRDHLKMTKESKQFQEFFVKEDIHLIQQNFQTLVNYCADDNLACCQIFKKLWAEYQNRFPHPATLYGMLNMGNAYLPINENWELFYRNNEKTCEETKEAGARALVTAAKRVLHDLKPDINGEARIDAWLFDVDWSIKGDHEFPEWYFKLFSKRGNVYLDKESLSSEDVTMKSAYVPLIFGMTYGPYPLHRSRYYGWGYLVPNEKAQNVGDPLGKHFLRYIDSKILRPTRHVDEFFVLLEALKTTKFWTNYAKRVESEIPVWYETSDGARLGAIAPAIVPAGTVSRRSVHKLWVTLTNESGTGRIGTGIKSLIQAPDGYLLVGADVDSQEQWLAGLFGDASHARSSLPCHRLILCLTPFSNMMLAGSKADGTDLHTVVANQLKIDRGQAKALNYSRMYGAGEINATNTLSKAGMTMAQAAQTAKELFAVTKGTESSGFCSISLTYSRSCVFIKTFRSFTIEFEKWVVSLVQKEKPDVPEANIVCSLYDDYSDIARLFNGGYESATFNYLEMQTHREVLRTPVLNCRLSDSLSGLPKDTPDKKYFTAKYKRSVMNWLVQSSAVDFLHLLLLCMEWLCKENNIRARFVISIHDEVRYLCPEEDAPRLALALMLSNMYVRSFISSKLGIEQLPLSVAFFSQVDCDTVLRKEVHIPCFNADGSPVPEGITYTIEDLLKITGGSLAADVTSSNEDCAKIKASS